MLFITIGIIGLLLSLGLIARVVSRPRTKLCIGCGRNRAPLGHVCAACDGDARR